jgi:hypothetical protein
VNSTKIIADRWTQKVIKKSFFQFVKRKKRKCAKIGKIKERKEFIGA